MIHGSRPLKTPEERAALFAFTPAPPFATDRDRVEHLFGLYEALVNPMAHEAARQNKRIARRSARKKH